MSTTLDLGCFHGGAFFDAIGDRFDDLSRRHRIVNADVLDAWFPPAPSVLQALHDDLDWLARTSPPTLCAGLRAEIATARRIPEANLVVGAGSSALIFLALREWLTPRSKVLLLDPCYGEYAHVLERVIGCTVDRIALRESDNWVPDLGEIARRLRRGYDLFVFVNPNNPTGQLVPRGAIEQLMSDLPSRTRVWIDEAYIDYVDGRESSESLAAGSRNVFVCKSLSKVYALSGMRAAYLCGPARDADRLRRITPPWAVSLPAQVAAVRALASPDYYLRRYHQTSLLRAQLIRAVDALPGIQRITGTANFLLCRMDDDAPSVAELALSCQQEGVFIRDVSNMGRTLASGIFRIAVRDVADNERMVNALASSLQTVMP